MFFGVLDLGGSVVALDQSQLRVQKQGPDFVSWSWTSPPVQTAPVAPGHTESSQDAGAECTHIARIFHPKEHLLQHYC